MSVECGGGQESGGAMQGSDKTATPNMKYLRVVQVLVGDTVKKRISLFDLRKTVHYSVK